MEAVGQNRFWGGHYPAWRELYHGARTAFTLNCCGTCGAVTSTELPPVGQGEHTHLSSTRSLHRVRLADRLRELQEHGPMGCSVMARSVRWPSIIPISLLVANATVEWRRRLVWNLATLFWIVESSLLPDAAR